MLAVALLFSSVSEAAWADTFSGQDLEAQSFQQRGGQMRGGQQSGGQQGMERPGGGEMLEALFEESGVDMPDDWEEMTREEQKEFMEESGIEMPERQEGMERGARESGDSSEEGQASPQRGGQGGGEKLTELFSDAGVDMPDDWEDMTQEERKEFMEDSGIEMPERETNGINQGQQTSVQKQMRNLIRKASKGKNFKKFTGQLKSKKTFADEDDIENLEAVNFMQQRGIMEGYSDGSFGADKSINRAESLKVLLESLGIDPVTTGESEFDDVENDAWYAGYIKAAKQLGFVKGYEDGTFKPGNTVNQAELLKISFESFGIDLSEYDVTDLPDGISEDAWFAPYLQYALDNELLDEDDVNLGEGMNREMFAEVISRLIQQQEAL